MFITPLPMLRFMERLGDPTLKTLSTAVDTMRDSMLGVIHVPPPSPPPLPPPLPPSFTAQMQKSQREYICNHAHLFPANVVQLLVDVRNVGYG